MSKLLSERNIGRQALDTDFRPEYSLLDQSATNKNDSLLIGRFARKNHPIHQLTTLQEWLNGYSPIFNRR
jgi:hypothetical protein